MTIENAMYTLLSVGSPSTPAEARVYPVKAPQHPTLPFLIYTKISAPRLYHLAGQTRLVRARFQVDCWAETYAGAVALAEAVRGLLSGFRGTVAGVVIGAVYLDNETDFWGDETEGYRRSLDFLVWHQE